MSTMCLPIRIRPNRMRIFGYICALTAIVIPVQLLFLNSWHELSAILLSPQFTMKFASALLVCLFLPVNYFAIAALVVMALPGAPFYHIQIDERFVTHRHLWGELRKFHRDVDGWAFQRHQKTVVRHALRFLVFKYCVVVRPQGFDPRQVRNQGIQLLEFDTLLFAPWFADHVYFTQSFADCLTAASEAVRQSKRPVVLEVPPQLASQAFELAPRPMPNTAPAHDAKQNRRPKKKQTPLPGRFPTHENLANYWRDTATQAGKASDDSPEIAYASERAYLYSQLAKRDRKNLAREQRALRLKERNAIRNGGADKNSVT